MARWIDFHDTANNRILLPMAKVRAIHFNNDASEVLTKGIIYHVLPGTGIALLETIHSHEEVTNIET